MISHRAYRDIQRCQAKYGLAWTEYTRRVPYLFIPVCLFFFPFLSLSLSLSFSLSLSLSPSLFYYLLSDVCAFWNICH